MGLVAIEDSPEQAFGLVLKTLGFIRKQAEERKDRFDGNKAPGDLPQLHEIFGKIKVDLKNMLAENKVYK